MTRLEKKNILVTGGASGIGKAVVTEYIKAGAKVYFLDMNAQKGKELVAELAEIGYSNLWFKQVDISQKEAVFEAFDHANEVMGGVNVLANIAGIHQPKPAATTSDEEIDFNLEVNIKGTIYTNQAAYKYMHDKGGSIINYGSLSALNPHVGSAMYS